MPARLDTSPCPTPFWLPEGHAQTIFAARCARHNHITFVRERVDTPDGDFIDIDWSAPGLYAAGATPSLAATGASANTPFSLPAALQRAAQPALVLFHGLEGSSASPYAQGVCEFFRARGWVVVVPHFRGCSGVPNRVPRAYHSGDSDEIAFMLDTLRARLPQARWHAVGVSLGGNALAKYLGEREAQASWLTACAVISAPIDLNAGGHALGAGPLNRYFYTRTFMRTLRNKVLDKAGRFPGVIDVLRVAHARDLYEFDDAYTAPIHGFANVVDYWTRASAKPWLPGIEVPTLVLNARNDPFLPGHYLPGPDEAGSRHVLLHQPATGGHVGFVSGRFPVLTDWLPKRIERFFLTND